MSWLNLNQSLNSLKGQITNFASEVLSEGAVQDSSESSSRTDVSWKELEEKCLNQELEIAALKQLNSELEAALQSERLSGKNGVKAEESVNKEESDNNDGSGWYWDPAYTSKKPELQEVQIKLLQDQISTLTAKLKEHKIVSEVEDELKRLKDENKHLTTNLEDLDNQHLQAMEKLLTLKTELQKNFEVLKQEHADLASTNEEYANERETLLKKIGEKDKEIEHLKAKRADYETLHHKYINLEKVHGVLKENVEKFQEENQNLHEEVFKLQEQVTKSEPEIELVKKHYELSNTVPREEFEKVIKELNDAKERFLNKEQPEETNIDDNAKTVIESLKRKIREQTLKISEKETNIDEKEHNSIASEKIMKLYNKYITFELPIDYIGEMPSSDNNIVLFKIESSFKTLHSFKKDIDALEHQLSEKNHYINHLKTQIDDLTGENEFITADVQHFERQLNDMKKNNDFLINELAVLKNTSKLEPIIETHEENVVKLETELDNCNKKNKTFESEIKRIEKELAEVKVEKILLQKSLNDLKNNYTVMLEEVEKFNNESKVVEELENSTKNENSVIHKKASDEIHELKNKLNVSTAKNEELSIDLHIVENDKVLLTKELDDLKYALSEISASHQELEELKFSLNKKVILVEEKLNEVVRRKKELEVLNETLILELEGKTQINNTLQAKLDKIISEKREIAEKLENLLNKNATIADMTPKLNTSVEHLMQNEGNQDNNSCIKEDTKPLHDLISDLKAKIVEQDLLKNEIRTLKEDKQELIEKKLLLEGELTNTDLKLMNSQNELEKIITELNDKTNAIEEINLSIVEKNRTIDDLTKTLNIKNEEALKLDLLLKETNSKFEDLSTRHELSFAELKKLQIEKDELYKMVLNLNVVIETRNIELSSANAYVENLDKICNELKATIASKDKQIKELDQSIVELRDKMGSFENFSRIHDEYLHLLQEKETIEKEATDLKNNLFTKDIELAEVKLETYNLKKTFDEYKNTLEAANKEKADLINLVNLKHNESIQYHNEIQRLNQVILEQTNEYNKTIAAKDLSIFDSCSKCENLKITMKEKDEIIKSLNENSTEYVRLKTELQHSNESGLIFKERCENLDKSLAIQLENVKRLTAENAQLSEKEQNSTKELERLRCHLVDMEENYTQELMTSEQKYTECQTRLYQIEQRAKQTSTVYTSNSIRANQEVETLRNQIKLLEKQREDVQAKLSDAEDARNKSEAALTNLQVVLEQFQLDKEREVHAATEKVRNKLKDMQCDNHALQDEIKRLNTKLEEATTGLQAAARLGDQVETKSAQINDLKEQVRSLQTGIEQAEQRYLAATSNQQDKVDKNLVKNLVINYVQTTAQNAANKMQVLRILSTVLDFNQKECEKLGLVRSSHVPDSLAAEFVKFLQNESKPRAALPNMMGLAQSSTRSSTPSSRKNSTMGPNPIMEPSHNRTPSSGSNNLLFQNLDALETTSQISLDPENITVRGTLDTGVTQPRDTEGAILKHVLRDM